MLKNYLTIALRQLRRDRSYTAINVLGLALGMAVCLLIGLYIQDELSYDRFHDHADRVMVLGFENSFGPRRSTAYPLGTVLAEQMPDVEGVARVLSGSQMDLNVPEAPTPFETEGAFVDPAFFDLFSFPLVAGTSLSGSSGPHEVLLTQSTANRLFGTADPLGRTITYDRPDTTHTLTVAGILADPPAQSTIRFDVLLPMAHLPIEYHAESGWGMQQFETYVLLREPMSAEAFSQRVEQITEPILEELGQAGRFSALALPDLYFSDLYTTSGYTGQRRYVYLFGSIAVLILLIAAINYINLMTARAGQRGREVGVRKTLGAHHRQLTLQFLGESCLLSLLALLLALVFVELTLPAFGTLFGKTFDASLTAYAGPLAWLSAGTLLVGLIASLYPALVLARYQPVRVLRGNLPARRGGGLRRVLVVFQFTITIALLVGTVVIYQQLQFVKSTSLGFDEEQVVAMTLPTRDLQQRAASIRQEMLEHTGVMQASAASAEPGRFNVQVGIRTSSMPGARTAQETVTFYDVRADAAYLSTLGLELVAGRGLSEERSSDRTSAYLLNETAAAELGWTPEEAIGQAFTLNGSDWPGEVVGVVQDFHFQSMHRAIAPVVLRLWHHPTYDAPAYRLVVAKVAPEAIAPAMDHLEAVVKRHAPEATFDYRFLDSTFDAMYRAEERLGRIFTVFAVLAVLVACLGLFGLAAFTAERRTKEIGIRKVLGASVAGLVALLSKEFLRLVVVAFVAAVPLAYLAMNRWLEDFAYRVEISWRIFLIAGLAALGVALVTVSYQAIKAALSDPVKSLRYE